MNHQTRSSLAGSLAFAFIATTAVAGEPIKLRGTIERVDGQMIVLKTRYGAQVKLTVTESPELVAVVKSSIADIKPGMLVGSSGHVQSDGAQRANEVHIIPDSMRGIGEDRFRQDSEPQIKTLNASVDEITVGVDGDLLTVKSKAGERKVIVPSGTPIVTFVPGERTDLRPGVAIFVADAKKQPEGLVQTGQIIYGRDGLTPPL